MCVGHPQHKTLPLMLAKRTVSGQHKETAQYTQHDDGLWFARKGRDTSSKCKYAHKLCITRFIDVQLSEIVFGAFYKQKMH